MEKRCSEKSKYAKDPGYICNPDTGRWVKKDGPTGKRILAQKAVVKAKPSPKKILFQKAVVKAKPSPKKKIYLAKKMTKSEVDRLSKLPEGPLIDTMLYLDPESLKYLCEVNKRIQAICKSKYFREQYKKIPREPFRLIKVKDKEETRTARGDFIVAMFGASPKEMHSKLGPPMPWNEWYFETVDGKHEIAISIGTTEEWEKIKRDEQKWSIYVRTDSNHPNVLKNFQDWFAQKYDFKFEDIRSIQWATPRISFNGKFFWNPGPLVFAY